jgi:enterochelin esterase-like enzyme/outer membrane protein assembly factor BamB
MDLSVPAAGVFEPGRSYRLEVVWKKKLGSGYSAISIVDGIAVTLFADQRSEYAAAFDAESGEELWRAEIGRRFPGHYGSQDGPISTPLIAAGRVFALDPGGMLFAFDLKTGEQLWTVDLPQDRGAATPFYGFSTAPVYFQGSVIVLTGGEKGSTVTAFEADTGETRWTAGNDSISYQSPLLVTIDGQPQLLVSGDHELMGLDPASGELLWTMEHGGDQRDIGGASANLVKASGNRYFLKNKATGSVLVELADGKDGTPAEELWESRHIKNTYVVAVYHDGYFYGYNTRILSCVDEATGEVVWKSRPPGDGFPILLDGHLVIVTKGGTVSIAPASPDGYDEIASLELFDDLVWTPASFANGSLYLRSLSEWARVDIVENAEQVRFAAQTGGVIPDSEFGRFVARLGGAADKTALIDQLMSTQESFPIVEGKEMVHFVYRGPGDDLALAGDLFGGRTDRPMHRVPGTDFFYYSARLEPDARIDYSFIRDFEEEIALDPLNPRQTQFWEDEYGSFVAMPDWVEPRHFAEPPDDSRGRLEELELKSPHLEESLTLKVYLPHGYEPAAERYPVAYVLNADGALHTGKLTQTLDNLIGRSVAPVIVVFVPFFGEWPYFAYVGDGKDEHVRILVEEIVPLVDRTYPTLASAESRAMIGTWFTAYTSVYATFKYPGMFGKLGLQSVRWEPGYEEENKALLSGPDRQPL